MCTAWYGCGKAWQDQTIVEQSERRLHKENNCAIIPVGRLERKLSRQFLWEIGLRRGPDKHGRTGHASTVCACCRCHFVSCSDGSRPPPYYYRWPGYVNWGKKHRWIDLMVYGFFLSASRKALNKSTIKCWRGSLETVERHERKFCPLAKPQIH